MPGGVKQGAEAGPTEPMPRFIKPCQARAVSEPPSGAGWVHEIKMDGYRIEARIEDGRVALLTRTGLDWTYRFPGLAPAFRQLAAGSAMLDGEVIVEDARGVSDFSLLLAALKSPRSAQLTYVAFDLLHHDGQSLLRHPLAERKQRLADLLAGHEGPIRYSQHLAGDGPRILLEAGKLGLEGLVSKRLDQPYRPGRQDWLKVKLTMSDEFVLCGYVDAASPKESVGALALGFHERDRLVYAGRVGTGFSRAEASRLWHELQGVRVASATVTIIDDNREVQWVRPTLVAQIEYAGWTADGLLRHARFKGMREDRPAAEVKRPRAA